MEDIELESTSTADAVLAGVRTAILDYCKRDSTVAALCGNITITSMWRLPNGQQVAKVYYPDRRNPQRLALSGSAALKPPGALSATASGTLRADVPALTWVTPATNSGTRPTRRRIAPTTSTSLATSLG
ncbi:unnamed protein product [Macrosiphum euphorbiae]|uniref:Uncharacterized protein n=1 Tax=Macrosiphum euphorbiae TaxID=13131 RepID=A0AAV0YAH8_9HEMI|nr:unnamed protein product [Macrosiphum euphorbiae]